MAWVIGIGVFLLLLFAFPRAMLSLVAILVIIIGSWFAWTYAQDQRRQADVALTKVLAVYDQGRCPADFPLLVKITNESGKTLERVSFSLKAFREGYSSPLYESGFRNYVTDRIIPPQSEWQTCWSVPQPSYSASTESIAANPLNTLEWRSDSILPIFERE
jgi:hypothetical protein